MAEKISSHEAVINRNERLLRDLANVFKVIGEESKDFKFIEKALSIYQKILASSEFTNIQYLRGIKLDLARLLHLVTLIFPGKHSEVTQKQKIDLIRGLIKESPGKGDYWVYYGIFETNQDVKLRSFYKALQIDSKVRE